MLAWNIFPGRGKCSKETDLRRCGRHRLASLGLPPQQAGQLQLRRIHSCLAPASQPRTTRVACSPRRRGPLGLRPKGKPLRTARPFLKPPLCKGRWHSFAVTEGLFRSCGSVPAGGALAGQAGLGALVQNKSGCTFPCSHFVTLHADQEVVSPLNMDNAWSDLHIERYARRPT